MIVEKSNIIIEKDTSGTEMSFGIGNAAFIIKILRDKMYADPIIALVREISCNARDAHREIGTPDEPIDFILPNYWESTLTIKDRGLGISPDRMENIFIRYGNSTKRSDNVQVGGFGMGGKVPFAYTDQFSIITITCEGSKNVKRTYIAYIDESEAGMMRCVSTLDTDEHTGTSIIIPVEKSKLKDFDKAVISSTYFWDVRPNITGRDINELPKYPDDPDVLYKGSNWSLLKQISNNYYYSNTNTVFDPQVSYAIIDGIPYKLDLNSLGITTYSYDRDWYSTISRKGIHLRFEIGELSLAANRDTIHYDEKTIARIKQRFDDVQLEIIKNIQSEIEKKETYLEAVSFYTEFNRTLQISANIDKIWNGIVIKEQMHLTKLHAVSAFEAVCFRYNHNSNIHKSFCDEIGFNDQNLIIFNDTGVKNVRQYAVPYLENKTYTRITVINAQDIELFKKEFIIASGVDLEHLHTINISEISLTKKPRAPRKPRAIKPTYEVQIAKVEKGTDYLEIQESTTIDLKNGEGFYVFDSRKKDVYKSGPGAREITKYEMKTLTSVACNEINKDVIVVKEKFADKIGPGWKPLYTGVKEYVEANYNVEDICNEIYPYLELPAKSDIYEALYKNNMSKLKPSSLMCFYFKKHDECVKANVKHQNTLRLFVMFGLDTSQYNTSFELNVLQIKRIYPLLEFIDLPYQYSYHNTDQYMKCIKATWDYINSVDEQQLTAVNSILEEETEAA